MNEFSPNVYEISKEDIISSTKKTTGITTFPLEIKIENEIYKTKIIDTGGQRNERKKWKQCFCEKKKKKKKLKIYKIRLFKRRYRWNFIYCFFK